MSDGINGSLSERAEARREATEREAAHAKGQHAPGCHPAWGMCECGLAERLSAENADLRARLEAAERKRDEALALLNEKDAALKAARAHKDDFAWSVERGGHVLERDLTKLLHKRCQQYEADLERAVAEVKRLQVIEQLAKEFQAKAMEFRAADRLGWPESEAAVAASKVHAAGEALFAALGKEAK